MQFPLTSNRGQRTDSAGQPSRDGQLRHAQDAGHDDPKPFVWKETVDDISQASDAFVCELLIHVHAGAYTRGRIELDARCLKARKNAAVVEPPTVRHPCLQPRGAVQLAPA
jgi:hypothetical protein